MDGCEKCCTWQLIIKIPCICRAYFGWQSSFSTRNSLLFYFLLSLWSLISVSVYQWLSHFCLWPRFLSWVAYPTACWSSPLRHLTDISDLPPSDSEFSFLPPQICLSFMFFSSKPQLLSLICLSHMPSSKEIPISISSWPSGPGLV